MRPMKLITDSGYLVEVRSSPRGWGEHTGSPFATREEAMAAARSVVGPSCFAVVTHPDGVREAVVFKERAGE